MEGQSKAVAVLVQPHGLKAARHHLSIAVGAACRFLGASRDGVPRLVGPFYFGSSGGHDSLLDNVFGNIDSGRIVRGTGKMEYW